MQREMHFNKISIINLKLWSNCLDNWIKVKEAKATLPKLLDKNSDTLFLFTMWIYLQNYIIVSEKIGK